MKFNIEGLSSLKKLQFESVKRSKIDFSIKNLPSLTEMCLSIFDTTIDEKIVTRLLDQAPHIKELFLSSSLSYFNLDNFVNLRKLLLNGLLDENFNLELFKNLCNRLENIEIIVTNIDEKAAFKLFDGYNFPYLVDLTINYISDMKRLTKRFMNGFSTLRKLAISGGKIEVIEHDAFSNMQQLTSLVLSYNRIRFIYKNTFSNLKNLETLNLYGNKLRNFDPEFVGLIKTAKFIV